MKTRTVAALVLAAAGAATASAQAQTMRPVLDYETAVRIQNACLAHAADTEYSMAVAVFDHGGNLVSFARARQSGRGTTQFAMWKGTSSALYGVPTSVSATWTDAVTGPDLATVGGGVPIFTRDGVGLGGVGVSGAPPAYDAECATVGIEAAGLLAARPE